MDILTRIVENRKKLIKEQGHEMGCPVPAQRPFPLNPFITDPFLICEVKRRSPSKGNINNQMEAAAQAKLYAESGVRSISVLTEPDFFGGSLSDLMKIKESFPHLAVLRKDFLISREDIDVSYRAGADAVLLIASILSEEELTDLYTYARSKGLQALVEVHNLEDIQKASSFEPELTGINCRDLKSFQLDLLHPMRMKHEIKWKTSLLFESGIHFKENAHFALSSGFRGLLVGESVVKKPELIKDLLSAFDESKPDFWSRLYSRKRPFVKICGITNEHDAHSAVDLGADLIGFIFAPSKRRAEFSLLKKINNLKVFKIAVLVARDKQQFLIPDEIPEFLKSGLIDAVQFSGSEMPAECYRAAFPYYKALQLKNLDDVNLINSYRSPRVLIDAYSPHLKGGTGHLIPDNLISKAKELKPLWLAGGLGPDNISSILESFQPELVDAASSTEISPGKKDPILLKSFLQRISEFKL